MSLTERTEVIEILIWIPERGIQINLTRFAFFQQRFPNLYGFTALSLMASKGQLVALIFPLKKSGQKEISLCALSVLERPWAWSKWSPAKAGLHAYLIDSCIHQAAENTAQRKRAIFGLKPINIWQSIAVNVTKSCYPLLTVTFTNSLMSGFAYGGTGLSSVWQHPSNC